jgi:transposase-like protein
VSRRVSPTEQIRAQIDALFDGSADLAGALEKVARLGAQLIIQSAMEAEVQAVLGRARYQRRASIGDAPAGSRNGYRPVTVKTTTGPVTVARPRLRGTDGRFVSGLFGPHPTRTEALESLVVAGFVRGLSVRDVQATLTEALGAEASLSKSTVARVCQVIKTDFDAWANRRLDDLLLDYLFLDASHFRMHAGARAEPVLAAWGITTDGNPVLVGLAAANAESTDAWAEFLSGLDQRGLRSPLLIVCDGAAGLIAAIDQIYPRSLRQRCLIHIARNVLAKVPRHMQAEVKAAYWAIFDLDQDQPPGPATVNAAQRRIHAFATRYGKQYPAAVRSLLADRDQLTSYLRFPHEHWRRIRHSNFIERGFGETRRRVKVIGRLPGEPSCLSLVWAVLDRAGRSWRGLTMTPTGLRLLQDLRRQLLHPPTQLPARTPADTPIGNHDTANTAA